MYLANIGDQGLDGLLRPCARHACAVYGYCAWSTTSAAAEFGGSRTPVDNPGGTVALIMLTRSSSPTTGPIPWLMEATATWMEDQLFDAVDDNRRDPAGSALAASDMPLDFATADMRGYGVWLFWRYLSEWAGPGASDDPNIIRYVWDNAAGDAYSLQWLQRVLARKGTTISDTLARFGARNRDPAHYYSEGRAYQNRPPLAARTLTRRSPTAHPHTATFYHLGQLFVRCMPLPTRRSAGAACCALRGHARDVPLFAKCRAPLKPHRSAATRCGSRGSAPAAARLVRFASHAVSFVELDLTSTRAPATGASKTPTVELRGTVAPWTR